MSSELLLDVLYTQPYLTTMCRHSSCLIYKLKFSHTSSFPLTGVTILRPSKCLEVYCGDARVLLDDEKQRARDDLVASGKLTAEQAGTHGMSCIVEALEQACRMLITSSSSLLQLHMLALVQ